MGTRADFYIGRGPDARWLGSCGFDGYPGSGLRKLTIAQTEDEFLSQVAERLRKSDGTTPDQGWPWPWEDSRTTDFAYAFDGGQVHICNFGYRWRTLAEWTAFEQRGEDEPADKEAVFPDMTAMQRVAYGPRSGLSVFVLKEGL